MGKRGQLRTVVLEAIEVYPVLRLEDDHDPGEQAFGMVVDLPSRLIKDYKRAKEGLLAAEDAIRQHLTATDGERAVNILGRWMRKGGV